MLVSVRVRARIRVRARVGAKIRVRVRVRVRGISFLKTVNTLHIHWYSDNPARTDMSYGAPCRHKGGPLGRWPRTLAA